VVKVRPDPLALNNGISSCDGIRGGLVKIYLWAIGTIYHFPRSIGSFSGKIVCSGLALHYMHVESMSLSRY
jgi:hypothetical protein